MAAEVAELLGGELLGVREPSEWIASRHSGFDEVVIVVSNPLAPTKLTFRQLELRGQRRVEPGFDSIARA